MAVSSPIPCAFGGRIRELARHGLAANDEIFDIGDGSRGADDVLELGAGHAVSGRFCSNRS
jgi:hypothetical protein